MSRKKNLFFIGLMILSFLLCIVILIMLYFSPSSLNSNIYFKRTPLENLLKFKYISADINGLTPVDIKLTDVTIDNNSISTILFQQNKPEENFNAKIINNGQNNFTIFQYFKNKNIGTYKFTLTGNTIKGIFVNMLNNKQYNFNGFLTNYTDVLLTSNIEHTYSTTMDNLFLEYPIYTGTYSVTGKSPKKDLLIEYNRYTGNIIEYSPSYPNTILNLKLVKPIYNSGIRFEVYNQKHPIGYVNLYYNNKNWTGVFSENLNNDNTSYIISLSGKY